MSGPKRTAAGIALAGALVTLGEACGRFAVLGVPSGLVFPPEILAQWLFSVIPMGLFSLGVSTLGGAAKWVAFAGMTLLWIAAAGAALHGALSLGRWFSSHRPLPPSLLFLCRFGPAALAAVALEWAGYGAGERIYTGAAAPPGYAGWLAVAPLLLAYAGALWLLERARWSATGRPAPLSAGLHPHERVD